MGNNDTDRLCIVDDLIHEEDSDEVIDYDDFFFDFGDLDEDNELPTIILESIGLLDDSESKPVAPESIDDYLGISH